VIGIEVHAQLATRTKLFCACPNRFGAPPNSLTCPVCTGQPGALPALNAEAVRLGVRAALAVGGEVARVSRFARKNYFYPDLPKGYQISQLEEPFCRGGGIELADGRRVRLNRIHLEEDAGKAIHDRGPMTRIDLNRAGVPLIEAVSEADLASAAEAHEYLTRLKELLSWIGASDCDMEKGSLRCDVNVSVHRPGEPWRAKVELKNLNSFRHVKDAIEHEVARQIRAWEAGLAVVQETRLWDPAAGVTRPMRSKEDAHDYRYFPEPDLPPLRIPAQLVERERAALPELPAARRARFRQELGLGEYDAGVLTGSRALAELFEAALAHASEPKPLANLVANGVLAGLAEAADAHAGYWPIEPHVLGALTHEIACGGLHANAARDLVERIVRGDRRPWRTIVAAEGLAQESDAAALEAWCRAAIDALPAAAEDARAGSDKALGPLVGRVRALSDGRANPPLARAILLRLLRDTDA